MTPGVRHAVEILGRVGGVARGTVFTAAGIFLLIAGRAPAADMRTTDKGGTTESAQTHHAYARQVLRPPV